jgi:hypothetical protein
MWSGQAGVRSVSWLYGRGQAPQVLSRQNSLMTTVRSQAETQPYYRVKHVKSSHPDSYQILRQPEQVLHDDQFCQDYAWAILQCLHEQVRLVEPSLAQSWSKPVLMELPTGGVLPTRVLSQLLSERGQVHDVFTIDRDTQLRPAKSKLKRLLEGQHNPFWAARALVHDFEARRLTLSDHYIIPEDTVETGNSMVLVMAAIALYWRRQRVARAQSDHPARTSDFGHQLRFTLLVPTLDQRHLNCSESLLQQFATQFGIQVTIGYSFSEDYTQQPVPEHGPSHLYVTAWLQQQGWLSKVAVP